MHSHSHEPKLDKKNTLVRIALLGITLLISLMIIYYSSDDQIVTETESSNVDTQEYYIGKVVAAGEVTRSDTYGELYFSQLVDVRLLNGPDVNNEFEISYDVANVNTDNRALSKGQSINISNYIAFLFQF